MLKCSGSSVRAKKTCPRVLTNRPSAACMTDASCLSKTKGEDILKTHCHSERQRRTCLRSYQHIGYPRNSLPTIYPMHYKIITVDCSVRSKNVGKTTPGIIK
jgi:hypothetical protein